MATQVGAIWEEGWDAYFANKTEADNPYNAETDKVRHLNWSRGFHAAQEKDNK